MARIVEARIVTTCPGRNFVTLKIETDGRRDRPRRRHAERPRTGGGELSRRPRHPLPDRPRRAAHRGHLAVSLSRRLLAARAGDHDARSPRSTWRCGTSRQSSRAAALPAAGRRLPRRRDGLRPRQRRDHRGDDRRSAAHTSGKAIRRSACSPACRACRRPTASRKDKIVLRAGRKRACRRDTSGRPRNTCASVPELFAAAREALGWDVHLLHDVHHRLTPIEAARLGKDLEPYRPFWLEDADAGREPGSVPPDPPAHDDAARGGRGVQHDLGLQRR